VVEKLALAVLPKLEMLQLSHTRLSETSWEKLAAASAQMAGDEGVATRAVPSGARGGADEDRTGRAEGRMGV